MNAEESMRTSPLRSASFRPSGDRHETPCTNLAQAVPFPGGPSQSVPRVDEVEEIAPESRLARRGARQNLLPCAQAPWRLAARGGKRIVFLSASEVWAFEAKQRLCFVHSRYGRFDVDLSLTELQSSTFARSLLRPHRNWLVHASKILRLEQVDDGLCLAVGESLSNDTGGLCVPVSRSLSSHVRRLLLADTIGLRVDRRSR
jgi:DNA-binding LytR/AlgR family response regulator